MNKIPKILITDFLFVKEHKVVNLNTIQCLSTIGNVDLISVNEYYRDDADWLNKLGVNIVNINVPGNRYGAVKGKIFSLRIMKKTRDIIKSTHYDFVISLAFDSCASLFGYFIFNKEEIIITHHKNIDEVSSGIKKILFNLYKDLYIHITYEQHFLHHLNNYLKVKKAYHIPHPISKTDTSTGLKMPHYDCVGLCNSNNESFLDKLEDLNENIEDLGLKILMRSKKERQNTNNLKFLNKFLDYNEYDALIQNSKYVFVPLPYNYKYRLSGSIYDALVRHKPVITTSYLHFKSIEERHPGICFYCDNAGNMLELLNKKINNSEFDNFIEEHSIEFIAKKYLLMFNSLSLTTE